MADKPGPFPIDAYFEDSDCAELTASEAPSLCTSITDYIYENGRRYHAYRAGAYWGSNDKESVDAMDILYVWAYV